MFNTKKVYISLVSPAGWERVSVIQIASRGYLLLRYARAPKITIMGRKLKLVVSAA